MIRDVKNRTSCSGVSGDMCRSRYTNNWNLDKILPNNNKYDKDNISDKYIIQVGNIIIVHYYLRYLIQHIE